MSQKTLKFELSPRDLKIKQLLSNEFLSVEIDAISSANPNRNGSYFTPEAMQKALPTFYNKPILGSFDSVRDDFGRHDSSDVKWDNDYENPYYDYTGGRYEVPLGLIRQSDEVKMVKKDDGLDWIVVSAAIWV